jgi:hypothetical protein
MKNWHHSFWESLGNYLGGKRGLNEVKKENKKYYGIWHKL